MFETETPPRTAADETIAPATGAERSPPVEIPAEILSTEALSGIIDNFVLREGTDYGAIELDHASKVRRVRKQLDAGDVTIVFDPESESVSLFTRSEWAKLSKNPL